MFFVDQFILMSDRFYLNFVEARFQSVSERRAFGVRPDAQHSTRTQMFLCRHQPFATVKRETVTSSQAIIG